MSLLGPWRTRAGAVAALLIGLQTLWRGVIVWRGYFTQDDFLMLDLGGGRLGGLIFYDYSGHWFPGGFVIAWLQAHQGALNWPVAAAVILGWQLVASVMMWLVLHRLAPRSWWCIPALAVMLFTPMSLWSTQWWAVAIQFLPVTFFLLVAVWAFLVDLQQRDQGGAPGWTQPLIVIAASFGLGFQERALLIPVVLVFVALALSPPTSPGLAVRSVLLRHRWLWLALTILNLAYLAIHRVIAPISTTGSGSVDPAPVIGNYLMRLFLPMAWGGPWQARVVGDSTVIPATWTVVLSASVTLALVVVTSRRGGWSARWGWALLAAYLLVDVALLFAGRAGLGEIAGLVPRYVADVAPVLGLTLGLVARGLPASSRRRTKLTAIVVTALYAASAAITTSWMDDYLHNEADRAYVATLRAQLRANPQAVLLDTFAPDSVMIGWFGEQGRVSTIAGRLPESPLFDVPSYDLRFADAHGVLREIDLLGGTSMKPAPDPNCGYSISSVPVRIPLLRPIELSQRGVLRIGYFTQGHGTLEVTAGDQTQQVDLRQELSLVDFVVTGEFDEVTVKADLDDDSVVCVTDLDVGSPWPRADG